MSDELLHDLAGKYADAELGEGIHDYNGVELWNAIYDAYIEGYTQAVDAFIAVNPHLAHLTVTPPKSE